MSLDVKFVPIKKFAPLISDWELKKQLKMQARAKTKEYEQREEKDSRFMQSYMKTTNFMERWMAILEVHMEKSTSNNVLTPLSENKHFDDLAGEIAQQIYKLNANFRVDDGRLFYNAPNEADSNVVFLLEIYYSPQLRLKYPLVTHAVFEYARDEFRVSVTNRYSDIQSQSKASIGGGYRRVMPLNAFLPQPPRYILVKPKEMVHMNKISKY